MEEHEIKCPSFGLETVNRPFHDFSSWSSDHRSKCKNPVCEQEYSMPEYVAALEQKLRDLRWPTGDPRITTAARKRVTPSG